MFVPAIWQRGGDGVSWPSGRGDGIARMNGGSMIGNTTTILMVLAIALLYMLPTLIAFGRGYSHRQDVAVVNILVGWTLIGWIAVFLWASLTYIEPEFT
ncbi:MAG: superinfection immunity protein [Stellaceae bacterium]